MKRADIRARPWRATSVALLPVWLFVVSGCAAERPATLPPVLDVPETVELGAFPAPLSGGDETIAAPPPTPPEATTTTTTDPPPDPITGPIGDEVSGNRVLLIGDTVLAATAPRFDGAMCDVLEAFGWQAEIAAEVGRFIEFGATVVGARITPDEPDWDAAAVMLGNHFDGDVERFDAEFDALITSLSPRPVLVYTLVDDDTFKASLNQVIRALPGHFPNVVVVDWAEIVAAEPDILTADTPSGLSDEGRGRLALFTAAAFGEPPTTDGAGCVPPVFIDDSAIVL